MCWDKILVEGPIVRKWMVIGLSISFSLTIYLLFLISTSFQNYSFSPDIDDLMNNWKKEPITQALKGTDCSEYLTPYSWNGVRTGCDCMNSSRVESQKITFFSCSRDQASCVNVQTVDPVQTKTWPSSQTPSSMFSACIFRLTGENFINSYAKKTTDSCSKVTIDNVTQERVKCGFSDQGDNSYEMCLTKCPFVSILNKDDSTKADYSSRLVGSLESTFYYTTSSVNEQEYPIVELTTQIPSVCMYKKDRIDVLSSSNSNTITYNSVWQYTLQRNYLTENCKQEDTRYFAVAKMPINEKEFLIQNKADANFPGYPTTSYINLYARRIIQFKEKCRSQGMLEELVQFYEKIDYYRDLRLTAILCQTFMIIILCILLVTTSCEIGFRMKSPYCCRYQAPNCIAVLCRKRQLTDNEISITDYWRLYDPCYVLWVFMYVLLQISCFVICVIFAVRTSIVQNQLKTISKSFCSDTLTNSILTELSNDFSDDVWSKDSILLITYPLFIVIQAVAFVFAMRIVTNHRREWFIQKMLKKKQSYLDSNDPVLTSEESEEENFKKELADQKVKEKQRYQQNQVLQADFIQRTNLINQSMSYFQTSRNNVSNNASNNGQTYQYELSRISYLQQTHSFNNSFNVSKNYNSNNGINNNNQTNTNQNQNYVNISIQNSLNNSSIQENNGANQTSQDSKQANPPSNESYKSNSIFQNNQKKQFNKQSSNPIRSVNGLKENFLGPDAI